MDNDVYQRAEKFFPWNLQKVILNSTIFPYWFKNHFYYFSQNTKSNLFKRVHISSGETQTLFDAEVLLKELSSRLTTSVAFNQLPLDKFMFVGNKLHLKFPYNNQSWIFDIENERLLDEEDENSDSLKSPDRKHYLKVHDHNLYIYNFNKTTKTQLTVDGIEHYDYATSPETNTKAVTLRLDSIKLPPVAIWSPDSTKFVTHKLDQRKVKNLHLLQNAPNGSQRPLVHKYKMSFSGDEIIPLAELLIVDILNNNLTPIDIEPLLSPYLTPIEFQWVWWNHHSSKIYFLVESRSSKDLSLYIADAKNGKATLLITEKTDSTYIEPSQFFLWPRQIIILEQQDKIVWLSEKSGFSHLYLYDLKMRHQEQSITSGEWCVREIHFYDDKNNWLYFTASGYNKKIDPYFKFLFRCRLDGTELTCLTNEKANHSIQFSPEKNCFLDTYSKIDTAPITKLKSLTGDLIATIETADISGLMDLNWVPPKRFHAKARDGFTNIYGNLYFPSNFDPNKKYPLIDHIYPGPQVYRTPANFSLYGLIFRSAWTAQALAELGFIVLHIDGLGTPGRSKAFHDATYKNMGDCGIPDHVIAIKELAERHNFIDLEKVGVTGFSGGGYAAARAMLLYPDFFKVGVSAAGNHDLRCYPASYGEKYNSLDTSTYESQSNASLANNLKGKLLLIHGEMDDNVHPCATYQLINALIHYNKYFDMLIMPNLNHRATFDHPYYMRRQWDYFIQNLLGQDAPFNEDYILSQIPSTFPQLIDW